MFPSFCLFTGDLCDCPSYSVLLYTLSSAVAVLFLLLLGLVVIKVSGLVVVVGGAN